MAKNSLDGFPQILQHAKCGATYQAFQPEEVVDAITDCSVCTAVRHDYQRSGGLVNRTTAGTPLASELGLVVFSGKPGPALPGQALF